MKKTIYVGLSIFSILIISYIIFTYFYIEHSKFDKALLYHDSSVVQKEVIAKLEKLKIPYEIDEQGYILYQSADEKIVKEIGAEINRKHMQIQHSISITTEEHKDYFISLLKKADIPFKTQRLPDKNNYRVEWDLKYDDKVQHLKIEFYKGIRGSRKPPKLAFSNEIEKEILLTLLNENNIPYELISSEVSKTISKIGDVIEYDWPHYEEVQELRLKARRIMREKEED